MLRAGITGVIACGLVLILSAAVLGSVELKVGYNNYGYWDEGGVNSTVESGYSLGIEFINDVDTEDRFEWGCGLSLETANEIKDSTEDLHFTPTYIFFNYNMAERETAPYFVLRLGCDLENNFSSPYWATGVGIDFARKFQIEAIYSVNISDDGNYSRTSLNFGFRL